MKIIYLVVLFFSLGLKSEVVSHRFALVADNDENYQYDNVWKSFMKFGYLQQIDPQNSSSLFNLYWEGTAELSTTHIHAKNRSVELSELVSYQNRMYGFCDRTGMMWEIMENFTLRPVHILFGLNGTRKNTKPPTKLPPPDHSKKHAKKLNPDTDEKRDFQKLVKKMFNGVQDDSLSFYQFPPVSLKFNTDTTAENTSIQQIEKCAPYFDPAQNLSPVCPIEWDELPQTQKTEWALVKDGLLYVGSTGREWVEADKTVKHYDMEWVNVINLTSSTSSSSSDKTPPPSSNYHVRHMDFSQPYQYMREITDTLFPGYLLHESAEWLEREQLWVFLPKHQSKILYSAEGDECHGSNLLFVANKDFSLVAATSIGPKEKGWGTSTFRFLRLPILNSCSNTSIFGKKTNKTNETKQVMEERLLLLQVKTTERCVLERQGKEGPQLLLDTKVGLFDMATGRSLLVCPPTNDPRAVPESAYPNETSITDAVKWRTALSLSDCSNKEEENGARDYEDSKQYEGNEMCYISTNDGYKYEGMYFLKDTNFADVKPKET